MARKVQPVSLFTVAKELGISVSTVSRVMNHRTGVGEDTRRATLDLLRKYNFKTNYPQPRQHRIAIVMADFGVNHYVARLLTGIYGHIRGGNITACTVLYDAAGPESLLSILRDQQCSGVILIDASRVANQLPELSESGLPHMLLDEQSAHERAGFIDHDSYSGSAAAVRHLLSLGHTRIGYLGHWNNTLNHIQRRAAYKNTLAEAGIEVPDVWFAKPPEGPAKSNMDIGAGMLRQLLTAAPDLTAVLSTNDEIAIGAMAGARAMGLEVPARLSVVGFDNYMFSGYSDPPLTTVHHPCEEEGRLAAAALDRHLATNGQEPLPKEILPTRLVVRASTAPPA